MRDAPADAALNPPPRRRIVVVSHEASRTGAPVVAGQLLSAFAADGWDTVVWHRWGGPRRVELDRLAAHTVVQPLNRLRVLLRRRSATKRSASAIDQWAIRRTLRTLAPDLVWCNTVVTTRVAAEAARRGIPTVLHSHEQREWFAPMSEDIRATIPGLHLVGCSPDAVATLAVEFNVPAEEIDLLTTAVDTKALATRSKGVNPADPPRVVGCGTIDVRKGADVFAAAATQAKAAGLPAEWRWVGGGVPLPGPVTWVGEVEDAVAELAAATVVAVPSRADAFPLVVLEAMALGRPIVASDVPGPAGQLGDAGILVSPDEPGALVDAVAALIDDPISAAGLGDTARRRCEEQWDIEVFTDRAIDIAERAISVARPRVKVLHLLHRLSIGGGVQTVVRRTAATVDRSAVEFEAATVRPRIEIDGFDDLPIRLHPGTHPGAVGLRDRVAIIIRNARTIRTVRPDVVQLHSGTAWLGLLARAVSPRTSILLEVHDAPGSGRHRRVTDRFEGWFARAVRATVLCHSTSVADEVRGRWRVPVSSIVTIPLSVDVQQMAPADSEGQRWRDQYGIAESAIVLTVIGRMVPSKRFQDAIAVLDLLVSDDAVAHRAVVLQLVGDGPERSALAAEAERRGLVDRVVFTGAIDDVREPLAATDVLLSTSEYEGFGLTLIEAMACGVPVVSRAVGGTTDIVVDKVTGRLLDSADPAALAKAAAALVNDRELRNRMGVASRKRAEDLFSNEVYGRAISSLYASLARPRR